MTNNNQELIDGLRQAADFLESKPELPFFGSQAIHFYCYDKEILKQAARNLGSFDKKFTEHYFELHHAINPMVLIEVCIPRDQVCTRVVTWNCPDDESLLKLVSPEAETQQA